MEFFQIELICELVVPDFLQSLRAVEGADLFLLDHLHARAALARRECLLYKYDACEVIDLAREGELLPTGLIRHLIQGRVLRVDYPLSQLKSNEPLEIKNLRLQEWLRRKLSSKEMRFYGETTYLFDE